MRGTAAILPVLALLAQPSFASYRRFYSGPPLPRSRVSFILEGGDGLSLCDIDGVVLHETFWTFSGIEGGELLPGQYTIRAAYHRRKTGATGVEVTHAGCTQVPVTLEAGHTYVLRAQLGFGAFRPVLLDTGESWESWGLSARKERLLRKRLDTVAKYFRGHRPVFAKAAALAEAKSRLDSDDARLLEAWGRIEGGNVVELVLSDRTLVVVVDKLKADRLIYHGLGDPANTFVAPRAGIRSVKILAATPDEYRRSQTP
jgi:hypothetical protein